MTETVSAPSAVSITTRSTATVHMREEFIKEGQSRLLTGVVRRTLGQSHSAFMRQGYKYLAQAVKPTNIARGISSVTGSVISGVVGIGYSIVQGQRGR